MKNFGIFRRTNNDNKTYEISFETKKLASDGENYDTTKITVYYDAADLINSGVNRILIKSALQENNNRSNLDSNSFSKLRKRALSYNKTKDKIIAEIDPKENISQGLIEKSGLGKQIKNTQTQEKINYSSKRFREPRSATQKDMLNSMFSGQRNKSSRQLPDVATRKESIAGIGERFSSGNGVSPSIASRESNTENKKQTLNFEVNLGVGESVFVVLLDNRNKEIYQVEPITSKNSGIFKSEILVDDRKNSNIDFFEKLNENPELISTTVQKSKNTHVLSITRNSSTITGVKLTRRKITSDYMASEYRSTGTYRFAIGKDRIKVNIPCNNDYPYIYRISMQSNFEDTGAVKDVYVPGDKLISPKFYVICYQILNEIAFRFYGIPSVAKRIRIVENSNTYHTSKEVYNSIINESLESVRIPLGEAKNDIVTYEIYYSNAYGIETFVDSKVKRLYNLQTDNAKILGGNVENLIDSNGNLNHKLEFKIKYPNPWIPEADDSYNGITDKMRRAALLQKQVAKVKITRHSSLGTAEVLGTYVLNQNLGGSSQINNVDVNLSSEFVKSVTINIDNSFRIDKNISAIQHGVRYFYEVRPFFYTLGNEFSMLTVPEKIVVESENGSLDYEYHPIQFDNQYAKETGNLFVVSQLEKNYSDLQEYSLSSNVRLFGTHYERNLNNDISSSGVIMLKQSDDGVDRFYVKINFNIPKSIASLCDHWVLYAAPSSTGNFFVLDNLSTEKRNIEYLDFLGPTLATNSIRYQLKGIGFNMLEVASSFPLDIEFPEQVKVSKVYEEGE